MNPNPFASPQDDEEQSAQIVEGPTNTTVTRIVALGAACVLAPTYGYLLWADKSIRVLPPLFAEVESWIFIAIFFWIAVAGVIAFREHTRVFANSISSSTIPPRNVNFHEVAYVRQVTDSPPAIYFIKQDGKEVVIRGGNRQLLAAFQGIAARFPPPAKVHG